MERLTAPHAVSEFRPGHRVCGRYVVTRRLRSDGFCSVFTGYAADARDKMVTVWQFHRAFGGSVAAFQREMLRVRGALDHRALAKVLAFGIESSGPVVVTARPFDTTLAEILSRTEPLRPNEVGFFVNELASGLEGLHRMRPPMVHAMISPECVLVAARSGPVWLDGAGIYGALQAAGWMDDHEVLPVPTPYVTPGVLLDGVDARADLFNLASLAFECLTGRKAYDGDDDSVVRAAIVKGVPTAPGGGMVSPRVRAMLDRAWSPSRAEAYESVIAFAMDLSQELVSANEIRHGKPTLQHIGLMESRSPSAETWRPPAQNAPETVVPTVVVNLHSDGPTPSDIPRAPMIPQGMGRTRTPPPDAQTDREVEQAFDDLFKQRNTAEFGIYAPPPEHVSGQHRAIGASVLGSGTGKGRTLTPVTQVGPGAEPDPVPGSDAPSADGTMPMYAHVEDLLDALATLNPSTDATAATTEARASVANLLGVTHNAKDDTQDKWTDSTPSVAPLPAPVPAQADVTAKYAPVPKVELGPDAPTAAPGAAPVAPSAPEAPVSAAATTSPESELVAPSSRASLIRSLRAPVRVPSVRRVVRVTKRTFTPAPAPAPAPAPKVPSTPAPVARPLEAPLATILSRVTVLLGAAVLLAGVVHTVGKIYVARLDRDAALARVEAERTRPEPVTVPEVSVVPPTPIPTPVPTPAPMPAPIVAPPTPPAPIVAPVIPPAPPPLVTRGRRPVVPTVASIADLDARVGRGVAPCVHTAPIGRHLRFDVRYNSAGVVTAVRVLGLFAHPPTMQCIISAAARQHVAPFSSPTWVHAFTFTTGIEGLTLTPPAAP